jgi:hypothetical protein
MTVKKLQPRGFDEILDNLREHKEKIDRAIRAIEALRDSAIPAAVVLENETNISLNKTDTYSGMNFLDAVRKLSAKTNGPLTTRQISDALLAGGFSSESQNPKKVIAAQLHRYADDGESGIVKAARSLWALDRERPLKASLADRSVQPSESIGGRGRRNGTTPGG